MQTRLRIFLSVLGLLATLLTAPMPISAQAPVPAQTSISEAEFVDLNRQGIALLQAGDVATAQDLLWRANELANLENSYSNDALRYHNIGMMRMYLAIGESANAIFFAARQVAEMESNGLQDHPLKLETSLLHGRALWQQDDYQQAAPILLKTYDELVRRGGMEQLEIEALYYFIRTARHLNYEGLADYFAAFYTAYPQTDALGDSDFVRVLYLHIEWGKEQGADADWILHSTQSLYEVTMAAKDLDAAFIVSLLGAHGDNLLDAGEFAAALPFLQDYHEALTAEAQFQIAYYSNALSLVQALRMTSGYNDALDILDEVYATATRENADATTRSVLLVQRGFYAEQSGRDDAQQSYLDSYFFARQENQIDDGFVLRIKARIDLSNPAVEDFSLRHELLGTPPPDVILTADGSVALDFFFRGKYAEFEGILAAKSLQTTDQPVVSDLNAALHYALIGDFIASRDLIASLRNSIPTLPDEGVAQDDPILDIIEILALSVMTEIDRQDAVAPLERLASVYDALPLTQKRLFLALQAKSQFSLDQEAAGKQSVLEYQALPEPEGEWTEWDLLADILIQNNLWLALPDSERKAAFEAARVRITNNSHLALFVSWARLVQFNNTAGADRRETALQEIGRFLGTFTQTLPEGHTFISTSEVAMARALQAQGRNEEALAWLDRAIESVTATPAGRKDIVALLISEKASSLTWMGRTEEAYVVAKTAYEMLSGIDAQPNIAAGVIERYVSIANYYLQDAERVAAILRPNLDDAEFMKRLDTATQFMLLHLYAGLLANFAPASEALTALRAAEVALGNDMTQWTTSRSHALFTSARIKYWDRDFVGAYADILLSTDLYFDWVEEAIGNDPQAGNTGVDQHAISLANHEAAIGWDLAQSLSSTE